LLVLGQRIEIRCSDAALLPPLLAQYEAFRAPRKSADAPDLLYDIARDSSTYSLLRHGRPAIASHHVAGLLFDLEKDITIAVQRRRPDLLFLHSAALEHHGAAYLLAGASGSGKSTTAWGLLHHGFGYLSDELAPLDVDTLQVHGYPRALCLKQNPPSAYPLPPGHLNCGPTLHVPTKALRGGVARVPCPLAALLFVEHRVGREPRLLPIGAAEASARLYTTTLNALAHPGRGLDAVLRVTSSVPGYVLEAGDLRLTCRLVVDLVNGAAP
jgi:hypothetical protein